MLSTPFFASMTPPLFSNIYALGDSHAGTLSPYTNVIPIGPETMFTMSSGNRLNDFISLFLSTGELKSNALWMFCFGEIDVRCHIHTQIHEKQRDEDEVIETLVDNYFQKIRSVHFPIAIMSVVPPVKIEGNEDKIYYTQKSPYPFIGPDDDRKRYTKKINEKLMLLTATHGIPYLDVYSAYVNSEGFLQMEFADKDLIHILNRSKVLDLLNENPIFTEYR